MAESSHGGTIQLRGVREAGLGGIDLRIPLRRLVCLAGSAGAGAQLLAERVLLGESRRRYLLSLSPFERERMGGIGTQAAVDGIDGLPPAQPLPPKVASDATVASHLHLAGDLTRVLRLRSRVTCGHCAGPCLSFHEEDVMRLVDERFADESILVVAPMTLAAEAIPGVVGELERVGFRRLRVDGQVVRIDALDPGASWTTDQVLQVVVDRLSPSGRTRSRLGEAVRTARAVAGGRTLLVTEAEHAWVDSRRACVDCGLACQEPDWDRIARGDASTTTVHVDGMPVGDLAGNLCLGDLAELTAGGREAEAQRLCRAGVVCEELSLDHLPLWRRLVDLSHGERLLLGIAAARVTGLAGVLHVVLSPPSALDEPSRRLVCSGLRSLVEEGASVVVLDGGEETHEWADDVIHIGEMAEPERLSPSQVSDSGVSEAEQLVIEPPAAGDVPVPAGRIVLPLSRFVAVGGPTGAGKSQLLRRIREGLSGAGRDLPRVQAPAVRRVIDLTTLERRSDSLLVETFGVSRDLARLFADAPAAREGGLGTDHFLLEKPGGRCAACEGQGMIRHALDLVEDVEVTCSRCEGRRFRDEVLATTAHGVTIAETFAMTVAEAEAHFGRERRVKEKLNEAVRCGLGGRRLDTRHHDLEEVERLLARLTRQQASVRRGDLVLMDRPLAGCDAASVAMVTNALHRLVASGASVLATDSTGRLTKTSQAGTIVICDLPHPAHASVS